MLYFGLSIGNFSPEEPRTILRNGSSRMRRKDAFLVGPNLVKHESTLVPTFDDRAGATAAFNVKILHRLNRELGADLDPAGFRHRASGGMLPTRALRCTSKACEQGVSITDARLDLHYVKGENDSYRKQS